MQIIHPTSEQHWLELRTQDITSTEISALFGISPYTTAFELWHRKKNKEYVKFEGNERMEWGIALQDTIAKKIAEKNSWTIRRMDEYMRDETLRIGSSFDFGVFGNGLLEIKNVDGLVFHNDWSEEEAPLHIEIQVQHQMLVSGVDVCHIGCLVGGNRLVLIKRTPDLKVQTAIKYAVEKFWKSIDENIEPKPNMEVDADFVSKLYNYAEPGKVINVDDSIKQMALQYKNLGEYIKNTEASRDAIKAQILMLIGNAEKAIGEGFSISATMVGPTHVSYDRQGYRLFKVNFKKEK